MEKIDPQARYVHEPEGSLWIGEPTYTADLPPEDWERAEGLITGLVAFADSIRCDSLVLALVDARDRVRIQAERARTEGWTEEADPTPGQFERVRRLLRRSDAFGGLAEAVRIAGEVEPDAEYRRYIREDLPAFVEAEAQDAEAELRRYKREIGLIED